MLIHVVERGDVHLIELVIYVITVMEIFKLNIGDNRTIKWEREVYILISLESVSWNHWGIIGEALHSPPHTKCIPGIPYPSTVAGLL